MAKDVTLKSPNGKEIYYPKTVTDLVYDNETGKTVKEMFDTLIANINTNATFAGIATPTTNPGVPNGSVFYFAFEDGVYSNFNIQDKLSDGCWIISNNANTWTATKLTVNTSFVEHILFIIAKSFNNNSVEYVDGILKSDGSIATNYKSWKTSNEFEFELVCVNASVATNISMGAVGAIIYDSAKTPIRTVEFSQGLNIIYRKENEKYIRVCSVKTDDIFSIVTSINTVIDTSINTAINTAITPVIERVERLEENKSEMDFSFGGYIDSTGKFKTHRLYQSTDFLSCDEIKITLTFDIAATLKCSYLNFYDEDKKWLKELSSTYIQNVTLENSVVEIPQEAVYVRISAQNQHPYSGLYHPKAIKPRISINKNINYVGTSIWWYDGKTLKPGVGGGQIAKGYQSLLKKSFKFLSDTGTSYCYSGSSLGALSAEDKGSICYYMNQWKTSSNALWTLDTITNDFKRNIPIGTKEDYTNNTGITTYYGALRVFKDKVLQLSGNDAVVVVSNSCRRNNSGYTSTSANTQGHTLVDYEKALMDVAVENDWYFVDQFRLCGVTDDTIMYTTIDGLHLNNLGFKLAVVPWINVFKMFEEI